MLTVIERPRFGGPDPNLHTFRIQFYLILEYTDGSIVVLYKLLNHLIVMR